MKPGANHRIFTEKIHKCLFHIILREKGILIWRLNFIKGINKGGKKEEGKEKKGRKKKGKERGEGRREGGRGGGKRENTKSILHVYQLHGYSSITILVFTFDTGTYLSTQGSCLFPLKYLK